MEKLWSPWRSQYIGTFKNENKSKVDVCFFCKAIESNKVSSDNLVVYVGDKAFVIMNKFPYNNGHLLIAPKRHTGEITELSDDEMFEIIKLQQISVRVLSEIYNPHGFNLGANLGRAAGAGVPGHLHYHVLPRWNGDTNFMPILAETKVLSQSLEESYKLISSAFKVIS
jgi:ATP adenylyltransferase